MIEINPRIDISFKKIFGVEENKDLLISLINSIVSEQDQVVDIELLNPYNAKNFSKDKLSILDIKARNKEGQLYNIEMQIANEKDYDKRALYYWGKLYTGQLKTSENYSKLQKAIGIHILNFSCISGTGKYHNRFVIKEKDDNVHYFKDLELHTIELEKFTENLSDELSDLMAKIKTSLDIWVSFLTKYDLLSKEGIPQNMRCEPIEKALNVLEVMNFSESERDAYEDHLKWLRIQANSLEKIREDSLAEGIEQGIEQGIERGKAEEKLILAKNMLIDGESIEKISRYTGLSTAKIITLKS